jgi:peroxiredoxin
MAFTESNMLPIGTLAPDFTLPNMVNGEVVTLRALPSAAATVVMFLCNHCPYVLYVNDTIVAITKDYAARGVTFLGISSNDAVNYPDDAPDKMTLHAAQVGYTFPYLYDESQAVAKAYDAACTPDFYIFDAQMCLAYRGRIDGARPKNDLPKTGEDLRNALNAVLAGQNPAEKQYPSGGCNIKWKK